ncbi:aminotransferase class I/II-fold pyridoxal phosphate-dependent enzyme [Candidatus Parcubacteria bacterium]|nr:MAG: aminotransferase class I/II-fold pyridoxal phosphate-dependent enzyme [Candidatus Parcubacteria bacterium]
MFTNGGANQRLKNLSPSPTLRIKELCRQLQTQGKKICDLGLGQSPFPAPNFLVKELRKNAHRVEYLPAPGLSSLRRAVAEFFNQRQNLDLTENNIVIGPGSKELLFLLQLANGGITILSTPSWVSYQPQAKIANKKIYYLKTDFSRSWKIQPKDLEQIPSSRKTNFLILNYPHNPSGLTYSQTELRALAQIARRRKIIIVADEIYGEFHHQGKHCSIARFYPEGTIIISGLSKWGSAGGWRLGTAAFPPQLEQLKNTVIALGTNTYSCAATPIQYAATQAFQNPEMKTYLQHTRRILQKLGSECFTILNQAGIKVHPPQGGFYLYLDFSPFKKQLSKKGIKTNQQLCSRLLKETGVVIIAGEEFLSHKNELVARLAYVDFDGKRALAASRHLGLNRSLPADFSQHYCRRTLEGCQKIKHWIENL